MESYKPEDVVKNKEIKVHPSIFNVIREKHDVEEKMLKVKHRIGVYSAKGGVGKTTVSINLAYTLNTMGFKVGLLDADIDCPNVTFFLGINHRIYEYPLKPFEHNGVKVLSTAMLTDDTSKPIVWRGPLIAKMVGDFLRNTEWGELDFLIIDLPPGTSDAPLSIMQLLNLTGFVLVTTPQHIAAVNTIRSGALVKKFNIALLGVVENMSDGSAKGGKEVAEALGCELLGTIEKNDLISKFSDEGKVPALEDNEIMDEFIKIAKKIADAEK